MAHRAIPGTGGRQQRFRRDARARGLRTTDAGRHGRSPRGRIPDVCFSCGRRTLYQYDRTQPNLTLYVNGGIGNPDRAFGTALSIATVLATQRLDGSIDQFKAQAAGDFSSGVMTLESRAWLAAVFVENGQSPDYVGQTLAAIQATDASDLQRVAKTYLESPTIALVLPRDKQ